MTLSKITGYLDENYQLHGSFGALTQLTALTVEEPLYREQCQAIWRLPLLQTLSLQLETDGVDEDPAGQFFPKSEVLTSLSIRGGCMSSVCSPCCGALRRITRNSLYCAESQHNSVL
jgi:hypothetical protein